MKKILSAVFVMAMLIITATITGSVLAAEPYVFDPVAEGLEDYPVIYFDEVNGTLTSANKITESTDSSKAYNSMTAAVTALNNAKTEGYIILVSDYYFSTSGAANNVFAMGSQGNFESHSYMVILRGMTREDGTRSKVYLGGMPHANGPLWLQNLDLVSMSKGDTYIAMLGHNFNWGTPGAGADDVKFSKAPNGNGVTPAAAAITIAGDGQNYTRSPIINLYSGQFNLELKITGAYGATNLNGDVTINNYGTDMSAGTISHGHSFLDRLNGSLYINIMGGKLPNTPTLVNGSNSYIDGDIFVTITGTPDLSNLQKFTINDYVAATPAGLKGASTLDMIGYLGADKASVISRIGSAFDTVLAKSVFVSESGDDSAAGEVNSPVATYAKAVELLGGQDGAIIVKDSVAIDNVAEASRSNLVIIQGIDANAKAVITGDYVLGGTTKFTSINIANGGAGAIVANGKELTIAEDVTTSAFDGKYIDVIAGKRDEIVKTTVTILAGTYNDIIATGLSGSEVYVDGSVKTKGIGFKNDAEFNALNIVNGTTVTNAVMELSEFIEAQAAKFALTGEGVAEVLLTAGSVNGSAQPFVRVEYYFNKKAGDTAVFTPELVIGETVYTAKEEAKAGWNVATFTISDAGQFSNFVFRPFGALTTAEAHNKLYIKGIAISCFQNENAPAYAEPTMSSGGDFIPVLEDLVLTSTELVNTSNLTNIEVASTPFVAGAATMYTPKAASDVKADYYVLKNGAVTSIIGEFYPYVRVEYYAYGRDSDDFGDVYPKLQIGSNVYTASQKLELNKWNIATFNISNMADAFQEFSFMPYGDATGLNEWNKLYVQEMSFSQTEDLSAAEYGTPDMTEDGILVPYVYTPDDGKPVVYVGKGGAYTGAPAGSIDSTKAYGSLDAAFKAIDGDATITEAYVIILDTFDCDRALPTHKKLITIRGREEDDGSKKEIQFNYMSNANGPIAFENLNLRWIPRKDGGDDNDRALANGSNPIIIGKPGVKDDVLVYIYNSNGGTVPTSVMLTGGNITINSGSFTVRLGAWGNTSTYNDVNITLNDGTLGSFVGTHAGSESSKSNTTINGDLNITINGGALASNFAGMTNSGWWTKINGNVNFVVNGGDFSAVANGAIHSNKPGQDGEAASAVLGDRIIDILGYNGDSSVVLSKINTSAFDILKVNSIYLSDDGTADGDGSKANPTNSLAKAHEFLTKGPDATKVYSGKIVISGSGFTVDGVVEEPAHSASVTYNSDGDAAIKFAAASKFVLAGDSEFKNVKFTNTTADTATIEAAGHTLTLDETVTCTAADGTCINIIGGKESGTVDSVNVIVKGGEFAGIKAGDSVTGDVNITVDGGVICGDIIGGSSVTDGVIGGNVKILLNNGTFKAQIVGGNEAAKAVVEGTTYIEVNGGKFVDNAALIATNVNAEATVSGNAEIKINAGDFSGMAAGNVNAGIGTCGDKTCLDYKLYEGEIAALEAALGKATFNVVVEKLQDKPEFSKSDKFVFIIENTGDPTKALSRKIPFKITQSAAQSGTPIVVSPKQLNLKVDGNDMMIMTIQTVKDTIETIRLVPNHNPTKGSRMVVDGYNINGRGVDVEKYKYAEIIYYYTVPEGQTPAVESMNINFVGKSAGIPSTKSEALVPNKWATAIIDLTEAFAGKTGALAQYHFDPFGANKKSTDVPADQYIDIASLTFYTDKPVTTIQGGNAPNAKIEAEEEAKKEQEAAQSKPTKIEDIVVNVVNLKSTVDNSGAFTAAQVTKDGMTVMEYTPSLDSDKELRIEGYNCMGKAISLNEYQYLTMKILVETDRTDVTFTPTITTQRGGVTDNPEAIKSSATIKSEVNLVPNEWTTVTLKLTPADPAFHITRQFHIMPIGMIKGNAMKEGEKFYLAEFVLSAQPPKAASSTDDADGEEVIEEELEVITESPAIVVNGTNLINSSGDFATFNSSVTDFDGKKVVKIQPANVAAPVSIDGSAIFGVTELTPNGALNLSTHRYAIISYYYASEDAEAVRTPEFTLLGGRIQNLDSVVNNVVAKGTASLKKNEWATVVVKLSGNGAGTLASGFNLRPFGNVAANNIANGDVLYIENITFVSNRPQ